MSKTHHVSDWYKLDNAGKIFPAVSNKKETNTFRVQMILKEEVDSDLLQLAADAVLERFPMFKVRLKSGFFWNYLDSNERPFVVLPLTHHVCGRLSPKENNGYLFQIYYRGPLIAVEMFHALADGTGALTLLKSLVYEYLSLKGYKLTPDNIIITKDSLPKKEEYADAQGIYYDPNNHKHVHEDRAFHIKGTPIEDNNIGLISGTFSTKKMLELSRQYQATITEYLTALTMLTIYTTQIKYREHLAYNQQPVKIFVPVNLRKHFPSDTLRNFSIFVKSDMKMNRPDITFDEILALVKDQFKAGMDKKELIRKMSENFAFERNIFLRITPYFLKKYALKIGYALMGITLNTLSLSNLGNVELPKSMVPYVDSISAAVYSGKYNTLNIAISSFQDKFKITFTRSIIETTIEREFFRHFTQQGIEVEIESNYVEEYSI